MQEGEDVARTATDKSRHLKRAAQVIAVMNAVLLLAAFAVVIGLSGRPVLDINPLISVVYTLLAILIISRQLDHTVGWLFLIIGFFAALGTLVFGFEEVAPFISSKQLLSLMVWTGELSWMPVFILPITLVIQFFPDGKLPSRRWWPVTAAALLGMLGLMAGFLLQPWTEEELAEVDIAGIYNPFGIQGSEEFLDLILQIAPVFLLMGVLGAMLMVIVCYRRSSGIKRTQMKWLVFTAVTGLSLLFVSDYVLGVISNLGLDRGLLANPQIVTDFHLKSFPIFLRCRWASPFYATGCLPLTSLSGARCNMPS